MKKLIMLLLFLTVIFSANGQITNFPYLEGFEHGGAFPNGWTQEHIRGTLNWTPVLTNSAETGRRPTYPNSGNYNILFYGSSGNTTKLITPRIYLNNLTNPVLEFYHTQWMGTGALQDTLKIYCKNSLSGEWKLLKKYGENIMNWEKDMISLPDKSNDYYIAFEGKVHLGNGIQLDDIQIFNYAGVIDAEISSIISPKAGLNYDLSNNEEVEVLIKNNGSSTINDFDLELELSRLLKSESFVLDKDNLPTFDWLPITGGYTYTIDISRNANFSNIQFTQTGMTTASYTLTNEDVSNMDNGTTYYWRINAVYQAIETYAGSINCLEQVNYSFTQTLDLSVKDAVYAVKVTVILTGDELYTNDSKSVTFRHVECVPVTDFPFFEGFEDADFPPQCWTTYDIDGGGTKWERNTNTANTYKGLGSAVHTRSTLTAQSGWLITPQISIPASGNMVIEFMSKNNNPSFNKYTGVWVSTDGNNPETSTFDEIRQLSGESVSTIWKKIVIPLSDNYAGENIYIGFKYDGLSADDWYIDDVKIWDFKDVVDVELSSIITPVTGRNLSSEEQVKILIKNNGSDPITNFPLTLYLDGDEVATEIFTGTISSLDWAEYTFTETLNLKLEGTYTVKVSASISDNVNPNAEITKQITHFWDPDLIPVITIEPNSFTYNGDYVLYYIEVMVEVGERVLTENDHYSWKINSIDVDDWSSGTRAGKVSINILGRNEFTGLDITVLYNIEKATLPINCEPENLTAVYGDLLSSVQLPACDNGERWQWENAGTTRVGNVGKNTHKARYVPYDTQNYNIINDIDIVVTVSIADGATVATPTLDYKTHNNVTINAVTQPVNGQEVEYAIKKADDVSETYDWQISLIFNDLEFLTTYNIYARAKGNDNCYAGPISPPLIVITDVPLTITTASLQKGYVDVEYEASFTAAGTMPIFWDYQGEIPNGLTFNTIGLIKGTPTTAGDYDFEVEASNDYGSVKKQFTIIIEKGAGVAVPVPTLDSKTHISITINAVTQPVNGQEVEYAIKKASDVSETYIWQNSLIFNSLEYSTAYNIYARSKNNNNYYAGTISPPLTVTTDDVPLTITTALLPKGTVDVEYGASFAADGAPPIFWDYQGDIPEGLDFYDFGLIEGTPTTAGDFDFEVEASNFYGSVKKQFTIVIEKGAGAAISAPTPDSKTETSITINAITPYNGQNVEYAISASNTPPETDWQTGLTFSNLNRNTTYYVFARAKENDNYHQGAVSQGTAISTNGQLNSIENVPNNNSLKAWVKDGMLHVSGLTPGKTWSVYTVAGTLVYQTVAESDKAGIQLIVSGIYIIQSENNTIKAVYN